MTAVITAIAVSAAAVAGASVYSANKSAKAQKQASDRQLQMTREQEAQKRQQFKRQNQNEVNIAGLLDQNTNGGGLASTMLTGAGGIDPTQMQLGGKNNLLGG